MSGPVLPKSLRSCLYECSVMHHRLEPKVHQFRYRIFMFSIDLDELPKITKNVFGFSWNGPGMYSFRETDHLSIVDGDLKQNIREYLSRNGIAFPPGGRVQLITLPRVLGYIFNPVSFYFCYTAEDEPVCAIAEVGNTFGEMKPYLLTNREPDGTFRLVAPKHFYVSPFSDLDLAFDFKLKLPGDAMEIHIDDRKGDRRILLSALTGKRVELTSPRLAWLTLKYPFITLKVIFLIHWHALLLWLKRVPLHLKEENPDLQQDVLRPHASIAANVQ